MQDFLNKKVLIMGLGLHGGGLSSAKFFLKRGANLIITDLRTESELISSIESLKPFKDKICYVLGEHRREDFLNAHLIIKNPAVSNNNEFLKLNSNVETDISFFLKYNKNPIIAVTGTKGKSTLVSLLLEVLKLKFEKTFLGGNIRKSPLDFLDDLDGSSPVILELSSWQLSSLKNKGFSPRVSIITNLYRDHQNTYLDFNDYIADKANIFKEQKAGLFLCDYKTFQNYYKYYTFSPNVEKVLFSLNKERGEMTAAKLLYLENESVILNEHNIKRELFNFDEPFLNLRYAKLLSLFIAAYFSIDLKEVSKLFKSFRGIEHRLEFVKSINSVKFYNDSASTIPESTLLSLESLKPFAKNLHLIIGGTDKELDFSSLSEVTNLVDTWVLLEGSATVKIEAFLNNKNITYFIFPSLLSCVEFSKSIAREGDIVLFSPAAASFELFKNEFERGETFKALI